MPDVLINGAAEAAITVYNRGLHYGDGLFETMRVQNGTVPLWSRHYQRLAQDCVRLGITAPEENVLVRELNEVVGQHTAGIVKLIVTAGATTRGYARSGEETCRMLLFYPPQEQPDQDRSQGVRVRFCDIRLSRNPRLAGIKHLNRLEYVLARNEWQDTEIVEGLLLDTSDNVIEATTANVFLVGADGLLTPDLEFAGVRGIMRQIVLEAAEHFDLSARECNLSRMDVLQADGVFLTNSVVGILPVRQIEDRTWDLHPLISKLMNKLQG